MTAAHEPRRAPGVHLSAEELSEVVEGRQDGAQGGVGPAQDVTEHLRDCGQCRDEADAMADLLAALADLERPTIPQEVALRIDAALAQAALADMSPSDESAPHASLGDSASPGGAAEPPPPESTPASVGTDADGGATPGHSRAPRRPPSPLPWTRRPGLRRTASRRPLGHIVGWTLASLALVGGLAGLATVIGSQSNSTSTGSASSASGAGRYPDNPQVQNGTASGDASVQALLTAWTRTVLSGAASSAGSSDAHEHALTAAPMSSPAAVSISQCEANPAFANRQVLGATYGLFDGTPAVLVVYANGDGSQSVFAMAYEAPCAPSSYRVLAEGTVPD